MTERPLPDVGDPEFAPFWAHTGRGELRVPRCAGCGRFRWPPRPVCAACHGFDFTWELVPPTGRLHTWTVVGHQTAPGLPPPYVVGLVELDEPARGVRLVGTVVDADPELLRVDQPVRARFEPIGSEVTLVYWTPN